MKIPSVKVGNNRLLKLAEFLEKLPKERFNFSHFLGTHCTPTSCGTSACALGWAYTMPKFRKLGARISRESGYGTYALMIGDIFDIKLQTLQLFGISEAETVEMFFYSSPNNYQFGSEYGKLPESATAKEVANNIRYVVARRGAELKKK